MLQIFHTADWHLGQTFHHHDRLFEHQQFLNWLLEQLQQQQPDALIFAGDVFDTINPSAASQKQYFQFLADAQQARPGLQMVITAGNHDAGSRLEAPRELLEAFQIRVVGTVPRNSDGQIDVDQLIVPLQDSNGRIAAYVLAVPFLRPADVPRITDAVDPWLAGIRELYCQTTQQAVQRREREAPDAAIVAMGHCHFSGGDESPDSERRLIIGGSECIGSEAFPTDLSYVALGHLHRVQQFDGGRVRYSGSPIPLSFSERTYQHQILQLFLNGAVVERTESLLVPRSVPLLTIPEQGAAAADDLLDLLRQTDLPTSVPHDQQPFLELRLLQDGPSPGFRKQAEELLQDKGARLVSIKPISQRTQNNSPTQPEEPTGDLLAAIQPEDVFRSHWKEQYDGEPDHAVIQVLREILHEEGVQS